jgi:hypothetical protein
VSTEPQPGIAKEDGKLRKIEIKARMLLIGEQVSESVPPFTRLNYNADTTYLLFIPKLNSSRCLGNLALECIYIHKVLIKLQN